MSTDVFIKSSLAASDAEENNRDQMVRPILRKKIDGEDGVVYDEHVFKAWVEYLRKLLRAVGSFRVDNELKLSLDQVETMRSLEIAGMKVINLFNVLQAERNEILSNPDISVNDKTKKMMGGVVPLLTNYVKAVCAVMTSVEDGHQHQAALKFLHESTNKLNVLKIDKLSVAINVFTGLVLAALSAYLVGLMPYVFTLAMAGATPVIAPIMIGGVGLFGLAYSVVGLKHHLSLASQWPSVMLKLNEEVGFFGGRCRGQDSGVQPVDGSAKVRVRF